MAVIAGLFYLKAKNIGDVNMVTIKKSLTEIGVTIARGQTYSKENLIVLLGKELFDKGKLKRIEKTKVFTKENLVLA